MAVSVRTRFEVFKRDKFTCRYCGRSTPDCVLQVDHVVPVAEGGSDDPMNLVTSCWECNSGKSSVPLDYVVTGEDPHDRAIALLERERQLREYNEVLAAVRARVEADLEVLIDAWKQILGWHDLYPRDKGWLRSALERYPAEAILSAMYQAQRYGKTESLAYVHAVLRRRAEEGQ